MAEFIAVGIIAIDQDRLVRPFVFDRFEVRSESGARFDIGYEHHNTVLVAKANAELSHILIPFFLKKNTTLLSFG
jgi:hypothetical protein